jgi:hypothetical protein
MKARFFFIAFTISFCLFYLSIGCAGNSSKKDELVEGERLASKVCASCHTFPDPSLLDKETWLSHTLPKMADFIHVEGLNDPYTGSELEKDKRKATREVQAPGLSLKEWKKIVNWYGTLAPSKPLDRIIKMTEINPLLSLFTPVPLYKEEYPVTTLVRIDSSGNGFFLGDGRAQIVYQFNKKIQVIDSFNVPVGITDFNKRQNSFETITMGSLRPPDSKLGRLGKTIGGTNFNVILDSLERPVHALYHDLNQDGKEDIIISEFGFRVGCLSWYENKGDDHYEKHILRELPGAIRTEVYDFNKDRLPDIVALMAQGDEGMFIYYNEGNGKFREERVLQFPPVYGSNYFQLVDFNQDGWVDILTTQGDNADYSIVVKAYHGIRIFLNNGKNHFDEKYFLPQYGAQKAIPFDFDNDGDPDIVSIAFFPDYDRYPLESFIYWENKGDNTFNRYSFPGATDGRWLTMDAGDIDGDGDKDVILGSAVFTVGIIPEQIRQKWLTHPVSAIILKNNLVKNSIHK